MPATRRRALPSKTPGRQGFQKRRIITWPPEGYTPNKGIDESNELFDLDPLAWRSAFDVEPLPDGIRRRNGLIFSSDTLGSTPIENTTGTEDMTAVTSEVGSVAQQFVASGGPHIIESIKLFMKLDVQPGVPIEISMGIQTDSSNEPSGTSLSNFEPSKFTKIFTDQLSSSFAEFTYTMLVPTSLADGTYWIVCRVSLPSGVNLVLKADMGGNPFANGKAGVRNVSSGNWSFGSGTDDLVFSVNKVGTEVEITGIHDFKDGFGNTKHIVAFTRTIYSNSSGTLTSLGLLDTDHGADVHPSIVTCDGRLCITNGIAGDPSKKYYIFSSSNKFENEGISKPTTQLTVTPSDTGGSLIEGQYFVDYYYVNKETPREIISNPRNEGDSSASNSGTISNGVTAGQLAIANMQTAIDRTNDRATHKRLMILGPGTRNKWVYAGVEVGILDNSATISNPGLFGSEAEFDHDLPPTHSIKMAGSDRQFIAGIESNPKRVMWSRARGTLISVESFPPFNRKDLGIGDDNTTALALVPPSIVLVGMRNSIWALDESQPGKPAELVSNRVGIAGHKAITVIGREAYFWSDSEKHKGPFKFDGRNITPLVALDKTVNGEGGTPNLNMSRISLVNCAHYAAGDTRFQWWSALTEAGDTEHNLILVYDYNLDAWTKYRISANIIGEVEVSSRNAIFLGTIAGREVQADSGNNDIGSEIKGEVTLRPLTFGDIHDRTHIRGLITRSQSTNLGDLLLVLTSDLDFGGEASSVTAVLNQAGAAGSILGTDSLPDFVLAGSGELLRKHSFRSVGRVFEARFSGTSNWYLNRLAWRVRESGRK